MPAAGDGVGESAARSDRRAPSVERAIIAHRGLPSAAPENTMASFRAAVDAGARWIEADVDLLGDGTAVILHDTLLDRTTDASGSMYDLRREDLERIDAGSWYDERFAGERIPTLDEVVAFLNTSRVNANIELKANEQGAARTVALIDTVVEALARLDAEREIIVSSFSQPLLMTLHQRHPELAIGVLCETATLGEDWRSVLELCGASFVHPQDAGLTADRVRAFIAAGYGVNVWTINDEKRAGRLFDWGCTGVFTDVAGELSL